MQARAHPRPLRPLTREHERRPGPRCRPTPATTPAAGSPAASAASPATSSSLPSPVITARCSNTDRVVASDQPTSAGSRSGRAARYAASRPACAASAAGRPGRTAATRGRAGRVAGGRRRCRFEPASAGASSMIDVGVGAADARMTTPRPGATRPPAGHGTGSASSLTAPAGPVHVRRRLPRVQRRRQHLVLQRQHHLDHPGRARRRLRVPDIRLHRAQPQTGRSSGRSCP